MDSSSSAVNVISPEPSLNTGEVIPMSEEVADENTFKILIASDTHLGFCDDDPEREKDSFTSFEEILEIANDRQADFLLLGGDLFHDNRPKISCILRATELLRKHCLGNRPVGFQYVGDPKRDFANQDEPGVNYYDSNINVALPVFTIHGNHDDPVGPTKTSAVDNLAAAKLLNHFGQWVNLNQITISPVLLTKGETKLALYGLGHMKDERLYRLMTNKKVVFVGPEEDKEDWFNIFVLHQNREKRGPKNYIPESLIPTFMNFVLWGHEHESKPELGQAAGLRNTRVLQPGSPVATSLCPGEAKDKHCFLLSINRRKYRIEPIKLRTVRPLVMRDVMAPEVFKSMNKNASEKEKCRHLETYLENLINRLISEGEDKLNGHPKQPTKPLIRVRVFYDNMGETFNAARFNQKFEEKVANDDIVVFKKMPMKREDGTLAIDVDEIEQLVLEQEENDDLDSHVEAIVESYFNQAKQDGKNDSLLEVLSERGLSEAVKTAVEKNDDKAIQVVIESQIEKAIQYLTCKSVTEDTAELLLEQFRARRETLKEQEQERVEVESLLAGIKPKGSKSTGNGEENNEDDDDDVVEVLSDEDEVASTSRGRGKGRGSRGGQRSSTSRGRGNRGGRGASAKAASKEDDDYSPDSRPSSPAVCELTSTTAFKAPGGRGRGAGGRGRGSRGKKAETTSSQGRPLKQTTLNIRRSPRKGAGWEFDDDSN